MATMNPFNNQVIDANVTFNGGSMNIGSDGTDNAINVGTAANAGRAIVIGNGTGTSSIAVNCGTGGASFGTTANAHTTTVGSTNGASATTVQSGSGALNVTSTNGTLTMNSGTGTVNISTDVAATTVNIASGAAVKSLTLGSSDTTSQTAIQSGTNGLNINSNNGNMVINSGTGTLGISTDASAATVNVATGTAAKVVQLGSTNGASSLALRYGTADFTLASATGTTMSVLDSGEMTMPLQPAFLATHTADQLNITGNNTTATLNYTTEIFDQNADYDGTNTFTAPITGRYFFYASCLMADLTAAVNQGALGIVTSNRNYTFGQAGWGSALDLSNQYQAQGGDLTDMDAGDTCHITIRVNGIGADTADAASAVNQTVFSGFLEC